MFDQLHPQLFPIIFDYLSQMQLLEMLLLDKCIYYQIMKYIASGKISSLDAFCNVYVLEDSLQNKAIQRKSLHRITYMQIYIISLKITKDQTHLDKYLYYYFSYRYPDEIIMLRKKCAARYKLELKICCEEYNRTDVLEKLSEDGISCPHCGFLFIDHQKRPRRILSYLVLQT